MTLAPISNIANYLKYNYFLDCDGIDNVTLRLWKFSDFCSRHTVGVAGDDIMFHILVAIVNVYNLGGFHGKQSHNTHQYRMNVALNITSQCCFVVNSIVALNITSQCCFVVNSIVALNITSQCCFVVNSIVALNITSQCCFVVNSIVALNITSQCCFVVNSIVALNITSQYCFVVNSIVALNITSQCCFVVNSIGP